MYQLDLSDKVAVIMGVANTRSLAWAGAEALRLAGARVVFTHVGEKFGANLRQLTGEYRDPLFYDCNVASDEEIDRTFDRIGDDLGRVDMLVHSIAFAPREALAGRFVDTTREGFRVALDISAYSFVRSARAAHSLKENEGSMITMTFLGAERVVPKYNVMGAAKAALENSVRQLASDLGPEGVRVNAISAGPINTLSARGVRDFSSALGMHEARAPLRRNVTQEDVGRTALYLLSELSSGVTGEIIHVDAGYSIMGF